MVDDRYDYEGVDSAKADKVMKTLLDKMGQTTQVLAHKCLKPTTTVIESLSCDKMAVL